MLHSGSSQDANFNTAYPVLNMLLDKFNSDYFLLNWYSWGGVHLSPLGTAAINRPIVPAPGDYGDGEIGGMIGRRNRSSRRKPAPMPLCPPQTPLVARKRTRATAVGSQLLTA
jgi:hypothetical protein